MDKPEIKLITLTDEDLDRLDQKLRELMLIISEIACRKASGDPTGGRIIFEELILGIIATLATRTKILMDTATIRFAKEAC